MAMVSCRKAFTAKLLQNAKKNADIFAVATDSRGSVTLPCEILFYGFKLFWDWICIYSVVTVLAIVGIEYSKRNLSEQSTK